MVTTVNSGRLPVWVIAVNASQMTNQGQLQGDNLQVRGGVLHNSGSVFANRALALTEC